jgi:uncharacterized membrane protein
MEQIFNKQNILGLAFILAVDNTYLYLNKGFYAPIIDPKENINVTFAFLSWIVIIASINLLVLSRPDLNSNLSFVYGAYLGFAMYALWNCTNYALYPSKWNIVVATGDTLWGSLLTGLTSYVMYNKFSF